MERELLLSAARTFGTPLYVYDAQRIAENVDLLHQAFGADVIIRYACKALSNPAVLEWVNALGCGIDAVSIGELRLALTAGLRPEQIHFTPSGAHLDEYLAAIEMGMDISIDNLEVLEVVGSKYPGLGIFLRMNPDVRSGAHAHLQVGANDSKFGLYPQEMAQAHAVISKNSLRIKGVHIHTGSEIHRPEDFFKAWRRGIEAAANYHQDIEVINLGGGYKPYYGEQQTIDDLHAIQTGLLDLLDHYDFGNGRPQLMIEPGKFLTANAGELLVEVTWLKVLKQRTYVYVNSGFNHLIRPMYYRVLHPITNLSNPEGEWRQYSVVGYLCETDTFAPAVELPPTRRGDILAIGRAGAYAMSMASNYNSRPRPAEVLWQDGEMKLIRDREM